MKLVVKKRLSKNERERAVMFGLVELFIKTNLPIGSCALKDHGFDFLSPATIRNYFAKLEKKGYLTQQHASGGRLPTAKAFKEYANAQIKKAQIPEKLDKMLCSELKTESKEIKSFLSCALETLSEATGHAAFISSPRFDQDFIRRLKLIYLEPHQLLYVIITDFGEIKTETIYSQKEISPSLLEKVEAFFLWRVNQAQKPVFADNTEAKLIQRIYNEIMVRHVVGYANCHEVDIFRTGLALLLSYPEFDSAERLSQGLALLENKELMRQMLGKTTELKVYIGKDLSAFGLQEAGYCIIAIPYYINQMQAGSVAIIGPMRLNYRQIFGIMQAFSEYLSEALARSTCKYKITFRKPEERLKINSSIFLEYKSI